MQYDILFLQGAGAESIKEEKPIIKQLQVALGNTVRIHHPELPDADDPKADAWREAIAKEIEGIKNPLIIVGHSLGGTTLLQHFSQVDPPENLLGVVLMGIPFWGKKDHEAQYALEDSAGEKLDKIENIYIYHSHDDEVVKFSHHDKYAQLIPSAKMIALKDIDHSYVGANIQLALDIQTIVENYKRTKKQDELKEQVGKVKEEKVKEEKAQEGNAQSEQKVQAKEKGAEQEQEQKPPAAAQDNQAEQNAKAEKQQAEQKEPPKG